MDEQVPRRLAELEEIVRADNRLITAMYNSDLEAGWPRDSYLLQKENEKRYGVDLGGD